MVVNDRRTAVDPVFYVTVCAAELIEDVIVHEQQADHLRELERLDSIARGLLRASNGNRRQAILLLDDVIDTLLEAGILELWRYRALCRFIREFE